MKIFKRVSHKNLFGRARSTTSSTKDSTSSLLEPSTYAGSPVPHLLVSNSPPLGEETRQIRRAIRDAQARLAKSTEWGTSGQGENDILFIEQHYSVLSAIRRIPIEILQEIILWAAVGQLANEVNAFRWRISYVSQAWRVAALSLSALWAVLPTVRLVKIQSESSGWERRQADCVAEVLRRSGNRPLTVTIEEDKKRHRFSYSALNLVVEHCERWETVTISVPITAMRGLAHIRGRLPQLRTLFLHMHIGIEYDGGVLLDMFESAPLLQRVHIIGSVPSNLKMPPTSQFLHYRHLCITYSHLTEVLNYSSLESLLISQKLFPISFPLATLPRLKKFDFVTDTPARGEGGLRCFDGLKLPALEELSVVFPFSSPSIIPSIIRMISKTGPSQTLHTLCLNPGTMAPGEMTALLRLTPALTALDTTCAPYTDIEALAANDSNGEPQLVPHLRVCKLMFDFIVNNFLDPKARVAMNRLARARCEGALDPMTLSLYSMSAEVHGMPWSQFKQSQLEDWVLVGAGARLAELNEALRKVPQLGKQEKRHAKIAEIFNDIENIQIGCAEDIYTSGIHITLRNMLEHEKSVFAHQRLQRCIQALLATWDSFMRRELGKVHWCCRGPLSITYVPDDNELRASSNALDIIYGLKNPMSTDEACWSSHLGLYGITLHWPRRMPYFEATI